MSVGTVSLKEEKEKLARELTHFLDIPQDYRYVIQKDMEDQRREAGLKVAEDLS